MRHALIVGARGVGKSTLIRRVLTELRCPVQGFFTRKETALLDPEKGCPLYLYPAGQPETRTQQNLLAWCMTTVGRPIAFPDVFDRYAPALAAPVPPGGVVVMDELGFLERDAHRFQAAVLARLEQSAPVLAAVKDRDNDFLRAVKEHPSCRCFFITPDNRDALTVEVCDWLREALGNPAQEPAEDSN